MLLLNQTPGILLPTLQHFSPVVKSITLDQPVEKAVGLTENETTYSAGMAKSVVSRLPFLITNLPVVIEVEGKVGMTDILGPKIC